MGYLMISVAVLLLAVDFAINKIYQQKNGTSFKAGMQFNFFLGLFTAIVFLILCGFNIHFSVYSLVMSIIMTVFAVSYNIIGFRILKSSGMSIYTMFLMNGGMIVPYVWGLFFLNEQFSILRTIGLVVMIAAIILANIDNQKKNWNSILFCILVFFLNGFVSVVSKLHQVEQVYENVTATEFVFYTGVVKFIVCGIILLVTSKSKKEKVIDMPVKILPIIIASAVIGGVSYMLQLFGAVDLPATVLYPFITGGSIVLSTIVGAVAFKEKLSTQKIVGVILCFIGTCMFL